MINPPLSSTRKKIFTSYRYLLIKLGLIALLHTCTLVYLWTISKKKVYMLPKHLDEKVARLHLAKIGVELDVLTPDQSEYLGISASGPYKPEYYRY